VGIQFVPDSFALTAYRPAIGLPIFILLGCAYFTMAFMLLGAVFLGIGAQAATMREIQMMSLPITIFQVAMFGLSSAAAGTPGSRVARIAEWFPFSSPFAMAAHGATDAALWPHLLALLWQALWVTITIWFAARMFSRGVLKSGGGIGGFSKKRAAAATM
jgi:ABC-2 type transport system permease protein